MHCVLFIPAVCNEVPYCSKEEPGHCIRHDKDKQRAAPVQIHQGCEDIRQVTVRLTHITVLHITTTVFLHIALPLTPVACWRETVRKREKLEQMTASKKRTQKSRQTPNTVTEQLTAIHI